MSIHVCSLKKLSHSIATHKPALLVSLMRMDPRSEVKIDMPMKRQLHISINDIITAQQGQVHAGERHIQALLDFAKTWDRSAPLLIHCFAGISRSTAAAYVVVCALQPQRDESEIAYELRGASPTACPNTLLVALADAALQREGRMVSAIKAIGSGLSGVEAQPFMLPLQT